MGKRGPKGRPAPSGARRPKPAQARAAVPPSPAARANTLRTIRRAAILFVALGVLLVSVYWYFTRPRAESAEAKRVVAEASAAAKAAGCSAVRTVGPYDPSDLDRTHVGTGVPTLPPLSSYPSVPPTSGPHDPVPLDAGVYATAPPIGGAIHSLEHGAVIVWYSPANVAEAGPLADFFDQKGNRDHVIVAPYDYPNQGSAGQLPAGVGMALVAWHRMQTCTTPSLPVAALFAQRYATPTQFVPVGRPRGYEGDAPEAGLAI